MSTPPKRAGNDKRPGLGGIKTVYAKNRKEWRVWLTRNHDKENKGIWLVFYKTKTDQPTIDYEAAVEEAICFGWIDGLIKKIDEEKYARKFTPRQPGSLWSQTNKRRAAKVIQEKRMTKYGLAKI